MSHRHPVPPEHLDALITLLTVVRLGRYSAAATTLGINHSTVSRRLAALEKTMGGRVLTQTPGGWEATALGLKAVEVAEEIERSLQKLHTDSDGGGLRGTVRIAAPEAFTTHIAIPALSRLRRAEPEIDVELISATQRASQARSGMDLQIVVEKPEVRKAAAVKLLDYQLGLYTAPGYLERRSPVLGLEDLTGLPLNYYVESLLQVDSLDKAADSLPPMKRGMSSTSVFGHVLATVEGNGIGLLPTFVAQEWVQRGRLVRILEKEYSHELSYWAVARSEALRSPLVMAAVEALRSSTA